RRRGEALMDFAAARGWRTGDNPARWAGHIETLLPARTALAPVEHFAALPIPELSGFMAELAQDDSTASRAFRFLVLTCARRDEVLGMTWSEMKLPNRVW